ncbi:MAG: TIGR04197 family type VII secretion effector [Pseudobutyrivibrio ruminis]|uniref:TIGR04197 family type VII secretion effector n=1 Tax=Pseudobutyrivibrio ruminis TaxID=46206 RepID=A0A927UA15_9FIRM|nr:TIGR04197 family type VII secretion effector [Pseudobutyrivibrio sp.]MBE5919048.1 TIGR04197 family type VII secretion effector [Pseudobutyrivibrio ruminis]MBQ6463698.1 TIGR04197 family type VII secretion effector [Pseudobutyrivibrio sp.]
MSGKNPTINVSQSNVSTQSSSVDSAASYLEMKDLSSKDSKSTISANGNGKQAYLEGQLLLQSLGETLDAEASNIESLGEDFKQYDEMLSGFWELGER